MQVQVAVSAPGQDGEREIRVFSRPEAAEEEELAWALNAEGLLSGEPAGTPEQLEAWPPAGAEQLELEEFYEHLALAGLEYGPAFQGLRRAWKVGEEVFAEVSLPEDRLAEAGRYSVHPALLDAALHAIAAGGIASAEQGPLLPFSWSGVSVAVTGAPALRVRLAPQGERRVSLALADESGMGLARVGSLALRAVSAEQLKAAPAQGQGLLGIAWGEAELEAPEGEQAEVKTWRHSPGAATDPLEQVQESTAQALQAIQGWLANPERAAGERLALITEGAIATSEEESPDPARAAIWGLARAAQAEHPGAFALIDSDGTEASEEALPAALAQSQEPQLALRQGKTLLPRAKRLPIPGEALLPPSGPWRLEATKPGTLEGLALVPAPAAERSLGPTEVRIAMRCAGLNFRDVLIALGHYPGEATIGSEGAGVIAEVGEAVTELAPGDRVTGMILDAFAPTAIADQAQLRRVPAEWSFEQAAAVPVVFCTALYALGDLASLKAGERVLIHAGAGGVGMAAIGVAKRLGAEVYATASQAKQKTLEELGIPPERIASSREGSFKQRFLQASGGEGMDVVLERAHRRAARRLPGALAEGRALLGDGQGRHPRPRGGGQGPPRRHIHPLRPRRSRARAQRRAARRGDRRAQLRRALPLADLDL